MTHADEHQAVTLINVFAVEPENQQALVDLLVRATDDVMRKQAGYLSARIHRSLDRRKVAVYARWRSTEDFMALTENADAAAHMQRARTLATFEPVLYDVVLTHESRTARDLSSAGEDAPCGHAHGGPPRSGAATDIRSPYAVLPGDTATR